MTAVRRMSHPRVLVSVCIDGCRMPGAALLVVRTGPKRGARFELDRRSFGSAETQRTVITSIAERIPRDAIVLAHTKHLSDHALRHSAVLGRPLPPDPPALIARYRPDLRTICLPCERRELLDAAAAYGIVAESGPMWTRMETRAARDAQALWLLFLWTHCRPKQRNWLAAAWEAWRGIERARKAQS
ncbi:hypothetical protein [Aurantiacibacter rhizosphaerae]|uniref:Uncharacterized protein n=1 Tax=Aurantiacibacter rhizosphaerae TaxID=2691582 RepID=A0A844X9D1_9SPHN|nr:hypothetical protein [Aurantiacibacter rhizosphaerae]MWV26947.1 hypothetical protein [Aurantiacibacter rhizosphaerae]